MEFKLIIKNDAVKGTEIKMSVVESLILSAALKQFYLNEENNELDRKRTYQMILDIEKGYKNV